MSCVKRAPVIPAAAGRDPVFVPVIPVASGRDPVFGSTTLKGAPTSIGRASFRRRPAFENCGSVARRDDGGAVLKGAPTNCRPSFENCGSVAWVPAYCRRDDGGAVFKGAPTNCRPSFENCGSVDWVPAYCRRDDGHD